MTTLTPETLAELRRLIDTASDTKSDPTARIRAKSALHVRWGTTMPQWLPALLDAAEERDRLAERVRDLEGELAHHRDPEMQPSQRYWEGRWRDADKELSALRATIAAGEPFDADEVGAMRASNEAALTGGIFVRREPAVPDELGQQVAHTSDGITTGWGRYLAGEWQKDAERG